MLKNILTIGLEELAYYFHSFRYKITNDRKHSNSRILVNGSPKTGTIWMLNMITSMPGYRRTRGFNFGGDLKRYHDVLVGEVVHGHDRFTPQLWQILQSKSFKVILMVRDPRDQTVSRMFHIRRDANHAWHQRMQSMGDDDALMACIEGRSDLPGTINMLAITNSWLNESNKALCIKYEDLLADPAGHLHKVLHYIGVPTNDKLIWAIVVRNSFERLSVGRRIWEPARKPGQQNPSSHFRKGIVGDWKNYFKTPHIQRYKEIAGQLLIDLGYEKDLSW